MLKLQTVQEVLRGVSAMPGTAPLARVPRPHHPRWSTVYHFLD